jgi:hypothetical protein
MVLEALHEEGSTPIPVVGLDRDTAYLRAVRAILSETGSALCVRLQAEDFVDAEHTAEQVGDLRARLGAGDVPAHVILDFRSIENVADEVVRTQSRAVYQRLSREGISRFVLLASSMPSSLSGMPTNTVRRIDRREFPLWRAIYEDSGGAVAYGDYGIVHPEYVDLDPRVIRPAAKIRYTSSQTWVVAKGRQYVLEPTQYRYLAALILREPEHRRGANGWGENYLRDCASGDEPSSNLERWVAVDTNTHIEFAIRQTTRIVLDTSEQATTR